MRPLGGSDYIRLVQQELTFARGISELGVAINITDDSQFELPEQFFGNLSTADSSVILNPVQTTVRILNNDGIIFLLIWSCPPIMIYPIM